MADDSPVPADPALAAKAPIPEAIVEFLGGDEKSLEFGSMGEGAPEEMAQFGQLTGLWHCHQYAFVQGQWFDGWDALWAWRYGVGGFVIEDYWYQPEANLPPTMTGFGRDVHLLNLRVFDSAAGFWRVAWLSNTNGVNGSTPFGTFEASLDGEGRLVMTPPPVEGQPLRRIVFQKMTAKSFEWLRQVSEDDGKSWETRFRIEATRIR